MTEQTFATKTDLSDYIATAIAGPSNETSPADFDIDAIVEEAFTYDPAAQAFIETGDFWAAVERNAR